MEGRDKKQVAVIVNAKDVSEPIFVSGISLNQLLVNIVEPYNNGEPFHVDGYKLNNKVVSRIKIMLISEQGMAVISKVHAAIQSRIETPTASARRRKAIQERAAITDSVIAMHAEDITSSVMTAFDLVAETASGQDEATFRQNVKQKIFDSIITIGTAAGVAWVQSQTG